MRSTTTSMCCWPIAEMSISLVWGSRATRIIMSASVTRCSTVESLSSSPLLFGSTAIEITGVGKTIGGKTTRVLLVAQRVAGVGLPELGDGGEIARADFGDRLEGLAEHLVERTGPLAHAARGVVDLVAGEPPREDAEERDLAGVGIDQRLEDQRRERRVLLAPPATPRRPRGWCRSPADAAPATGSSEKTDSAIAAVPQFLRRDREEQRDDLPGEHAGPEPLADFLLAEGLPVEVLLQKPVVALGDPLGEALARGRDLVRHLRGNLPEGLLAARVVLEEPRLAEEQVDDPAQRSLGADRHLDRDRAHAEERLGVLQHLREARALAVELRDHDHPRQRRSRRRPSRAPRSRT